MLCKSAYWLLSGVLVCLWVSQATAGGLKEGAVPTTLVPDPGIPVVVPPVSNPPVCKGHWVTTNESAGFYQEVQIPSLCCCEPGYSVGVTAAPITSSRFVCDGE